MVPVSLAFSSANWPRRFSRSQMTMSWAAREFSSSALRAFKRLFSLLSWVTLSVSWRLCWVWAWTWFSKETVVLASAVTSFESYALSLWICAFCAKIWL